MLPGLKLISCECTLALLALYRYGVCGRVCVSPLFVFEGMEACVFSACCKIDAMRMLTCVLLKASRVWI